MKVIENVIVRMPNWLGDMVMAIPVVEDLKAHFPHAKISALCLSHFADLLANNPHLEEVIPFSKAKGFCQKLFHKKVVKSLKQKNYDLGVLLPNSLSSAWMFWQAGISRRLGYRANGRAIFLTDAPSFPSLRKEQHLVRTYKELLAPLEITPSDSSPKVYVSDQELLQARQKLAAWGVREGTKLVGINAHAAYGPAKCWPQKKYRALIEQLLAHTDASVLCFGDGKAKDWVAPIVEGLPDRVVNLTAKTSLRELIVNMKLCDVMVTNDSGPMHLAAACQIPLVAIFGSTSPVVTGPYNSGCIVQKPVSCSPCFRRECPIDFPCMEKISVEEVYAHTLQQGNL